MNNKDEDGNENMTHTVERGIQPARMLKNENVGGADGLLERLTDWSSFAVNHPVWTQ